MEPMHLAYLLIAVGLLMFLAEMFIPSGGLIFILALCTVIAGVVMTFLYSEDPYTGWFTLMGVFIAVPAMSAFLFHYWPRTSMGKRMILSGSEEDSTVASMPVNLELEQLRGRFGRALAALRPAGTAEFDGKRIDVITEGMMVEAGQWLRCIDVRAGRVVVRPVDQPNLEKLEQADFS